MVREGKDIGFIIRPNKLSNTKVFFNSFFYWIILVILLCTIPFANIYANEKYKLIDNYDYKRQKSANKILKKYMKQATSCFKNNSDGFYPAAQNGLKNYLSDKLKINRGSSTETLLATIEKQSTNTELLNSIKSFFDRCNQARFMPGGFDAETMKNDFDNLQQILTRLSKEKF